MRPIHSEDEEMDHDASGQHPFLSYAKQVSFPKWNVMVGELGEKFTRRSSLEKETTETSENENTDHTSSTYGNEKTSEQELRSRLEWTPKIKQTATEENTHCEGEAKQNEAKSSSEVGVERKPIFRYCEIIKEESRESDEEINDENGNKMQSYVSTVNITLKPKNNQVLAPKVSQNNNVYPQMHISSTGTDSINTHAFPNENVDDKRHVKSDITMNTADEKRLRRTVAFDENHLAPQSIEQTAREKKTHKTNKARFRKKSSSFSGVLPLRFPVTNDENQTEESAPHSPALGARHAPVRRRGTIDMGRIDMPKSPKINGGRPKRADPSHYLMQNMGKRRGSYNPTYDQSNLKMNKPRKNHTRAKSMHIVHTEERLSLRERLMQHACPELRESLELDISDNDDNDGKSRKEDGLKERKGKNRQEMSSSELTRRKISLAKSASFNSFAGLTNNDKETKTNDVSEDGDKTNIGDNLQPNNRSVTRKTGRAERNNETITEHQTLSTSMSDSEQRHGRKHHSRHHGQLNTRARNTRAQSSFDGVSPMYLGRLRQKSMEHRKLDRTKSDSMSSVSSSEGSEISLSDPFPMHYAAKNGKIKQLQKIISCGKNVNVLDADGWPPIHYALTAGHFECVACLLNAGANITDYSKERTSKYFR